MTHLLEQVGRALYGEAWQGPLARALGSSTDRALRRWLSGENEVPAGVWKDIWQLCEDHRAALESVTNEVVVKIWQMEKRS